MILRASDRSSVANAEVTTNGKPSGAYAYGVLSNAVTLAANTSYYLISTEDAFDACLDASTTLASTSDLTIDGAVTVATAQPNWDSTLWTCTLTAPGAHGFGPVTLRYTTATVPGLGLAPWPLHSQQAAFIAGAGELSTTVDFPQTGIFAFGFDCAVGANAGGNLRFFLDGQEITPDRFGTGLPSTGWSPGGWSRPDASLLEYTTAAFTISATGPHTLRIVGAPWDWAPNSRVFLDHLQVLSLDTLFSSGIPGAGQANGQVGIDNYQEQIRSQSRYAQAYGLKVAAYEGGWSLGGDFGQLPVQQWAKYRDPRAATGERDSADIFAAAGGVLYTYGSYDQWLAVDTPNADTFPLTVGIDASNALLPREAAFGFLAPQVLAPGRATWSRDTGGDRRGSFLTWNILAPQRAQYPITVASSVAGGSAQLLVDGWPVGAAAPGGADFTRTVTLGKGLHTVLVRTTSAAAFATDSVTVALAGTLAAPASVTADDGDASVALSWSAVTGATGYRILWGTTTGLPDHSRDVPASSLATVVDGLTNNVTWYFRVVTLNAAGPGLPSPEVGRMPFADGQSAALAVWQFPSIVGNEPSAPATSGSTRAAAIPLTRGSGLEPMDWLRHDCFAGSVGNWPTSLAEAKTRQIYLTYGIAPIAGRRLSLEQVDMRVFWQNWVPGSPYRDCISYSTDGGATFTDATLPLAEGEYQDAVVDLSGVAALQNISSPVLFRVYFWNIQSSCTVGLGERNHAAIRIVGSVAAGAAPRDAWRLQHFGSAANVGPGADFADPDGDGMSNVLEYAVGSNPKSITTAPVIAGTAAGHLTIAFTRMRDATDVTYHVEASDDLGAWKEVWTSATNPYPGGTALSAQQVVTDTAAPAGATRRFLRLHVTAP
ncbi:MAG: fibronectin type III domain-containing protein [Opitutaceae bacterium]|nr:fibronectin type III domain-containing protein [Opitutaceae bacterium]